MGPAQAFKGARPTARRVTTPNPPSQADVDLKLRTLFVGMVAAFVIYGLGFAFAYAIPGPVGLWINIGCIAASLIFVAAWLLAVRGGFRLGKPPSKAQQRAKEKARFEREKQRSSRLRRSR